MVNLLFIELHSEKLRDTAPFVTAYDLDYPGPNKRQWRVDRARGVESGVNRDGSGMRGVWAYLAAGTWLQLTQQEAYTKFPELQTAIENWVEPW
jgi:hypothetical protein